MTEAIKVGDKVETCVLDCWDVAHCYFLGGLSSRARIAACAWREGGEGCRKLNGAVLKLSKGLCQKMKSVKQSGTKVTSESLSTLRGHDLQILVVGSMKCGQTDRCGE